MGFLIDITTRSFCSEGHRIVYDDLGAGEPIVLLHGFAADRRTNWRLTGWYRTLCNAGYRVIAPDARGHGSSDKPLDSADYQPEGIAADVVRLLDHLGLDQANIFGYSMGARNLAWLLTQHQDRVSSAVIAGAGLNVLKVDDPEHWTSRGFKLTADNEQQESLARPWIKPLVQRINRIGGTPGALSACLLGSFVSLDPDQFQDINTRALVVAGEKDTVSGSPVPLAECIPGAKAVVVPGRSHLTTLTDAYFRGAVLGFLGDGWTVRQSA